MFFLVSLLSCFYLLLFMRIWSIHPRYLDSKRLVAVWRETLLAKAVLEGKTKGYTNHPQLIRFRKQKDPISFINTYLYHIHEEAVKRGYKFDFKKITNNLTKEKILVNDKQVLYELEHLRKKLDYPEYLKNIVNAELHPVFKMVKGDIESWEKLTKNL